MLIRNHRQVIRDFSAVPSQIVAQELSQQPRSSEPSLSVTLSVVCPLAPSQHAPRLPSAAHPHCPPLGQLRGKDCPKSAEEDCAPSSNTAGTQIPLPGKMEESGFSTGMESQFVKQVKMPIPPVPVGTPKADDVSPGKRSGETQLVVVRKKQQKLNQILKEVPEPPLHPSPTDKISKIIMPKNAKKLSCGECNEDILKPNHFG